MNYSKKITKFFSSSMDKRKDHAPIRNIQKLKGDASERVYHRISTGKTSFISCLDKPVRQFPFIIMQKIFKTHHVNVPEIYDVDEKNGYYLQEDLGDETLLTSLSSIDNDEQERVLYNNAIELLIKIHSIDIDPYKDFEFVKQSFDKKKLQSEVEHTWQYLVEREMDHRSKKDKRIVLDIFDEICTELVKEKMVVTHRDFHSRNLMIKNGRFFTVDFQDARMGIPQYDLVSLLEDCYYSISEANKKHLKDYYWNSLNKWQSRDRFDYLYDLMTLQRTFKAMGSFAFVALKNPYYLRYIGFCFEKIRRVLVKYPSFGMMRKTLSGIYYGH